MFSGSFTRQEWLSNVAVQCPAVISPCPKYIILVLIALARKCYTPFDCLIISVS